MRTFEHPFDHYELDKHRAITVELHPYGLTAYGQLYENPIYYFNSFQYMGGDFYRAVLGYGDVWDKPFEEKLVMSLDFYLDWLSERSEYYFEQLEFLHRTRVHGISWHRGIKPKRIDLRLRHPKLVEPGTRALARINLLDKPNHVDVEFFGTGEVFTISYIQYLRWRNGKKLKVKENAKTSRQAKPRTATSSSERSGREESSKALVIKLPGLCPRERGAHSVREARQKAS